MPESPRDWAAEYALGVLEGSEQAEVSARARDDAGFVTETMRWAERFEALAEQALPAGQEARPPPPEIWQAISRRVGAQALVRRAGEGEWMPVGPGARMKMLMVDPPTGRRSALLRLEPGAEFAAHDHDDVEECLVLEGETTIDGSLYRAGDYIVAPAGTRHSTILSPRGVLVMLHWARV